MARLPGINYGAGVPSTGREDPMRPVNAANAQARAAASIGAAASDIGNVIAEVEREKGRNSAAEAASEFVRQEAEIRTNPNIEERNVQIEDLRLSMEDTYTDESGGVASKEFRENFGVWSQRRVDKVFTDGVEENFAKQRETTEIRSQELASEGELEGALAFIAGSGVFNDTEKAKLSESARLNFTLGDIDRTIASRDPDAISTMLSEVDAEDYTGPMSPTQRRAATTQLKAAFELSVAEFEAKEAKATELQASNLELGVRNGLTGPAQIHQAFVDDTITGPKRTQLMMLWQIAQSAAVTKANNIELVDTSIVDGRPLDRTNSNHTDAVDDWYDDIIETYGDNPQLVLEHGVNAASKTNILPEQMEADLRRMAFAGSNENVAAAANIYEVLEREAPQTIPDIGTREVAIYKQVLAFQRGGAPLADAVERARENAFKPQVERTILNQRYNIEVAPDITSAIGGLEDWLDGEDQFDVSWGWGGAPDVTNAQFSAYRSSEMAYFQLTNGDIQMARQMAREDFSRLFATSKINGGSQIMAFSPEREYGVELGGGILKQDLEAFYGEEKLDDSAFILSDGVTGRDPLGARTYAVYTLDEYGLPQKHTSRWKPDRERMDRLHEEEVAEGIEQSKRQEKITADVIRWKMEMEAF